MPKYVVKNADGGPVVHNTQEKAMPGFKPFDEQDYLAAMKECHANSALKKHFRGFKVSEAQRDNSKPPRLPDFDTQGWWRLANAHLTDDQIKVCFNESEGYTNWIWDRSTFCTCEKPHLQKGSWDKNADRGTCFYCRKVLTAERMAETKGAVEVRPWTDQDFQAAVTCLVPSQREKLHHFHISRHHEERWVHTPQHYYVGAYHIHTACVPDIHPDNIIMHDAGHNSLGQYVRDSLAVQEMTDRDRAALKINGAVRDRAQEAVDHINSRSSASQVNMQKRAKMNPPKDMEGIEEIVAAYGYKRQASVRMPKPAKQITHTAEFEFPNGDRFTIPDPIEPEWKGSDVIVDPWSKPLVHNTEYGDRSSHYALCDGDGGCTKIQGPNGTSLDFAHKEGKLIADEYARRAVREKAKVLWWREWKRPLSKSVPRRKYTPPRYFKRATEVLMAEKNAIPVEGSKGRPEWPEGKHPRRIIEEGREETDEK